MQAIVIQDFTRLQFVSGFKIVKNNLGQEDFLIMTNRYQKLATGTVNFNEINFRVLKANVANAIQGTKCVTKLKRFSSFSWVHENPTNQTDLEDKFEYELDGHE